uniref:Uncharacterized protein n=1 Tax=Leersia perrieri TaxID=77586 RepID=A0A0D9WPB7_9ORYZ
MHNITGNLGEMSIADFVRGSSFLSSIYHPDDFRVIDVFGHNWIHTINIPSFFKLGLINFHHVCFSIILRRSRWMLIRSSAHKHRSSRSRLPGRLSHLRLLLMHNITGNLGDLSIADCVRGSSFLSSIYHPDDFHVIDIFGHNWINTINNPSFFKLGLINFHHVCLCVCLCLCLCLCVCERESKIFVCVTKSKISVCVCV